MLISAVVALFCGLVLSLAVLPTIVTCKSGSNSVVTPVPTEEEHSHSRDAGKVNEAEFARTWCSSERLLGRMLRVAMRDRGEALPDHPLTAMPDRPPRQA